MTEQGEAAKEITWVPVYVEQAICDLIPDTPHAREIARRDWAWTDEHPSHGNDLTRWQREAIRQRRDLIALRDTIERSELCQSCGSDERVEAAPVDAGKLQRPDVEMFAPDGPHYRMAEADAYMDAQDREVTTLRASLESMRERAEKAKARGLELEQAVSAHICNTCYRWNCCEHDTGCPKTSAEKENV